MKYARGPSGCVVELKEESGTEGIFEEADEERLDFGQEEKQYLMQLMCRCGGMWTGVKSST